MRKRDEIMKRLRAKVDQLWQIAAENACGRQVAAVAHLYHDIQGLFAELTLIEKETNASQDGTTTAVHGPVCKEPEQSEKEVPIQGGGGGLRNQD